MTLALMIVLAAAVAAWVLAPLRGSADRGVPRRGVPAEPHDEWPDGKRNAASVPAGDGARTAWDDAPGRHRLTPARLARLTRAPALWWGTAAIAACVMSAPLGGAASTGGRIQGRVVDHTAPQHPVARQTVRLTIVERGVSSDQDVISDTAGRFQFMGLPVGGVRVFVLSTEYRGVRYASDRVVLGPDAPARTVDLVVYESSPRRSAIRGTVAFAVVDVARGAARVSVVQGFANGTDQTVVASAEDPIVFPLPPGAEMVTTLAGWRDPHIAAGRITDTFPLTPGRAQVAYTYGLEARGSQLAVPWSLPYGAEDLEVLIADAGVEVIAEGLTARDTVTGPKGRYLRWSGGPVARGGHVVVHLRGVPSASRPWPAAVAAGLGLVLSCGLAIAVRRSRRISV